MQSAGYRYWYQVELRIIYPYRLVGFHRDVAFHRCSKTFRHVKYLVGWYQVPGILVILFES